MKRASARTTVALMVLLLSVLSVHAVPPKAKTATNSVRVDAPLELVLFFEELGVDLSAYRSGREIAPTMERRIQALYVAEDSQGDKIHSPRINGIASRALARAYDEVDAPVYLEFGPLYWGYWREKDGLSESDS